MKQFLTQPMKKFLFIAIKIKQLSHIKIIQLSVLTQL
jgi:hypothetical protein